MRSVKYHVAYWAVACAGNIIYRASTLTLGVPELLFQALLVPLLVFFVTLVVQGPCPEPWPRLYYIASGALLVSLGSVSRYFYIPSVGVIQPNNFVHCCVAFEVAGTLESVRQDVSEAGSPTIYMAQSRSNLHVSQRQDIEPCSVGIFMEAVRRNLGSRRRGIVEFYSVWLSYMLTLMFVTSIFDLFFIRSYGAKATCLSIVGYYLPNNQGPAGSFALLFYVAAAVEDVAETVRSSPSRKIVNMVKGTVLISMAPWSSCSSSFSSAVAYAGQRSLKERRRFLIPDGAGSVLAVKSRRHRL